MIHCGYQQIRLGSIDGLAPTVEDAETLVLILWCMTPSGTVKLWQDVRWVILTHKGTRGWVYGDELAPVVAEGRSC